jgi:hypothetical protein
MARKKIDGSVASYLMDAVEHMTSLEGQMREMRWRLCWRDDLRVHAVQSAKKHCRGMLRDLEMVEHCIRHPDDEFDDNVVPLTTKEVK